MDPAKLTFIISQPRSGSTMLQLMLGRHPRIMAPSEPWVALALCNAFSGLQWSPICPPGDSLGALKAFFAGTDFAEVDAFARDCALRAYGSLKGNNGHIVVDKTPPYHRILPWLESVFPEARFIVLNRHPLAVMASVTKRWYGGDLAKAIHARYDDLVCAPQRLVNLRPQAGRRHVVRYESLVAEPKHELNRLCRFLGIDFVDAMVQYGSDAAATAAVQQGFGDKFTTVEHQQPVAAPVNAWMAEPFYDALLQAAARHFPPEFWEVAGYNIPALPPASPLPGESFQIVDLNLPSAWEYNSYGHAIQEHNGTSFDHIFASATLEDHVATQMIVTKPAKNGGSVVVGFMDVGENLQIHPAARMIVQDQHLNEICHTHWPLRVTGLCLPLNLQPTTSGIRFVFTAPPGVSITLPKRIIIQYG